MESFSAEEGWHGWRGGRGVVEVCVDGMAWRRLAWRGGGWRGWLGVAEAGVARRRLAWMVSTDSGPSRQWEKTNMRGKI